MHTIFKHLLATVNYDLYYLCSGYLPPEYTKFHLLSPAFDIFSLGIIITKIMMGRERYHEIADMPPRKLINLVRTRIYVSFLILILLNLFNIK
jgi:hypothetical protein